MSYVAGAYTFRSVTVGGQELPNISLEPASTIGLTIFRSIDVDETEEEISSAPCVIYSLYLYNAATSKRFVKFYNANLAGTTVGSTTPAATFVLEADQGLAMALPHGLRFTTACTVAATTGIADANTGAPGANEVIAVIGYA
jgi:hypothetical protein